MRQSVSFAASSAGGVLFLLAFAYPQDQQKGSVPAPKMVPDRGWEPQPGDRATVTKPDAIGCKTLDDYRDLLKFAEAKDDAGIKGLTKGGSAVIVPDGTSVLVIKDHRPKPKGVSGPMSGTDFQRQLQADILRPKSYAEEHPPIEVRILEGPHKDLRVFVEASFVQRLIPAPVPPPPPKKKEPPKAKPMSPSAKADALMAQAKALEKSNTRGAISYYRRVAREYPGSPQAKRAEKRAKELEGR
jgi:hypothetical protein